MRTWPLFVRPPNSKVDPARPSGVSQAQLTLRAVIWLAALTLAGPSTAAELMRSRCHMGQCLWLSIEERDLVGSNSFGALFKARIKGWESSHPQASYDKPAPRTGGEERIRFFFCSKTRPAVISRTQAWDSLERRWKDGGWMLHKMDPQAGPPGVHSLHGLILYFAACHGRVPSSIGDGDDFRELAERFGYPTSSDPTGEWGDIPIADPTDVLRNP